MYLKKEKGGSPAYSASIYLTFLQILLIFSIFMTLNVFLEGRILLKNLSIDETLIKALGVLFMIGLNTFNYLHYKEKADALKSKYKNHPLNKRFKIWMLYLVALSLLCFPFALKMLI